MNTAAARSTFCVPAHSVLIYTSHHTTGIDRWSPLSLLYLFDIVWDIMPDIMHSIVGIVKDKLMLLLGGSEKAEYKEPKERVLPARESAADKKTRLDADKRDHKRWKDLEKVLRSVRYVYNESPLVYTRCNIGSTFSTRIV